ncbi:MAG: hypothetical protein ABIP17_09110 [Ilumatobacteraceae bacterium]
MRPEPVTQVHGELNGPLIRISELDLALTDSVGEVPLRSPPLGVENEAGPRVPSESEEALHVPGQRITSGLVVQQHVGGELGDLDAVVDDQVGLEAAS